MALDMTDTAIRSDPLIQSVPSRERIAPALHVMPTAMWETAVAGFDGICQEQTYTFGRLRWPSLHHESIVFKAGSETVGAALMRVQKLPLGLGSIAISKWGPMLKHNTRPDRADIYRGMIAALVEEYADRRGLMLSVLPRAAASVENEELAILKDMGFQEGSNAPFPNRYLVNLQISETEQRASFEQKWRYHLKRSESAGLTFEHAPAAAIGDFTRLYEAMSSRKKFPDYSAFQTLPSLMEMPERSLRPELFFVRKGEELVAGAVIFKAGDTATYLYGATNEQALPLRAGYFLHWHIIRWLKQNTSARWYDLGGTDGFHGLHQFKKGMVGDAGAISPLPPMMNYASSRRALTIGKIAYAARDFILDGRHRLRLKLSGLARPDQIRETGDS